MILLHGMGKNAQFTFFDKHGAVTLPWFVYNEDWVNFDAFNVAKILVYSENGLKSVISIKQSTQSLPTDFNVSEEKLRVYDEEEEWD